MGAYVPAAHAHIGVVDRLFSRVGAADDLARGRSTFMVEMVETAAILNQATHRSLVILDEIGRGTATFDGLSIAYACVEHLNAVNRSRALFATHFHELTGLAETLPRLINLTMRVSEFKGSLVFLHEVVAGAADRSYGIQVAKLAGLPASVDPAGAESAGRSRSLAAERHARCAAAVLLRAARAAPAPARDSLREALAALDPDAMSPRDAHAALYQLKRTDRGQGLTGSGGRPVLNAESGNRAKRAVIGDEHGVVLDRMGGDHEVERGERPAAPFEVRREGPHIVARSRPSRAGRRLRPEIRRRRREALSRSGRLATP